MNRKCLATILLSVFLVFGCAHEDSIKKPAPELFSDAQHLADKGKTEDAADRFMQVRTYYPGDQLARQSLLSLADLYFDDRQYESALVYYREYRLLYPTDPETRYSLFRIGMCHFNSMESKDRDQTESLAAIDVFRTYLERFPDSQYADQAAEKLFAAETLVAEHNLYIGKYYLKKHKYAAACGRFEYIRNNYGYIDLGEDLDKLIDKACNR